MKPILTCILALCLAGGAQLAQAMPVHYGQAAEGETSTQPVVLPLASQSVTQPAASTLAADSTLFFTPSLVYSRLDQRARAEDYELESDVYQLQFDVELVGPGWAYHRVRLGHSFADYSELTSGQEADVDLRFGQASYAVGVLAQETWAGDWNFWTGLGWEGTRFTGPQDDKHYRRSVYLPFGASWAVHHAAHTYFTLGGEYRLLVRGWEKYASQRQYQPTQSDSSAYALWLGMDYVTANQRVLTARISYDVWDTSANQALEDPVIDSRSKRLSLSLGVRF